MIYYCVDCFNPHHPKIATKKIVWDLGSKWVCEDCFKEYQKGGFA